MKKSTVLRLFKTQEAVARALGITHQAVSLWGESVPEGKAYKLQAITGGKLKVDPRCYRKQPKPKERPPWLEIG